jgi:hypothetical protein
MAELFQIMDILLTMREKLPELSTKGISDQTKEAFEAFKNFKREPLQSLARAAEKVEEAMNELEDDGHDPDAEELLRKHASDLKSALAELGWLGRMAQKFNVDELITAAAKHVSDEKEDKTAEGGQEQTPTRDGASKKGGAKTAVAPTTDTQSGSTGVTSDLYQVDEEFLTVIGGQWVQAHHWKSVIYPTLQYIPVDAEYKAALIQYMKLPIKPPSKVKLGAEVDMEPVTSFEDAWLLKRFFDYMYVEQGPDKVERYHLSTRYTGHYDFVDLVPKSQAQTWPVFKQHPKGFVYHKK